MIFINRSEINQMKKHIVDDLTDMTEFDLFEANHCNEDWHIVEDVEGV